MTGDQADILGRIKALLPHRWFAGSTPVLDAVLGGVAVSLAFVYSLIAYAQLQTRIATATDGFLDLISFDFFGTNLPRRASEQDAPFRTRILANLLPEKGTRAGMIKALVRLTGRTPIIFEPARPADTGAYGAICGYGVAGGYGSLALPHQCFVKAFRPSGSGIPNISGYGIPTGAYTTPSQSEYANLSMIQGVVADADIYAAIDATKQAASTVWTQLAN